MSRIVRLIVFLSAVLCLAGSMSAATFTVTKSADTADGACDADCSFREAVLAANSAAGNDTIVFDPTVFGVPQTIVLGGTEIVVGAGVLTINGPGAALLTLDANLASRILTVGTGATANISGIKFTRGNGVGALNSGRGGAIYTAGGISVISNSIITGNSAANGGGLNNAAVTTPADTTLINCIVTNNSSTSSGGGMQNFSTSTFRIINSTISGNTSASGGGGAMQANGTVHIVNSTFSGNTSNGTTGGAIYSNGALFIMTNSTVTGNTAATNAGGLHRPSSDPDGYLRNSIIAGNTGPGSDVTNTAGGLQSQGNNIVGTVGTSTGWIASDLLNVNPMLGPLADNGGFTQTHLPMAGSPAINAGQNCVLDSSCGANNPIVNVTTDQRGVLRPFGGIVDIGSVEVAVAASATVSGRVTTADGYGVYNAVVILENPSGADYISRTSVFGYFVFEGVATGVTYTASVGVKGRSFMPQMVVVNGDVNDLNFVASAGTFK